MTSSGHWFTQISTYENIQFDPSKLIQVKNVELKSLFHEKEEKLTENLTIIPFKVPHRDEYSETVGFKIIGPNKSALFIPDIDKWNKWESESEEEYMI